MYEEMVNDLKIIQERLRCECNGNVVEESNHILSLPRNTEMTGFMFRYNIKDCTASVACTVEVPISTVRDVINCGDIAYALGVKLQIRLWIYIGTSDHCIHGYTVLLLNEGESRGVWLRCMPDRHTMSLMIDRLIECIKDSKLNEQ